MKKITFYIIVLAFLQSITSFAQQEQSVLVIKSQEFIVKQKRDSALIYIEGIKDNDKRLFFKNIIASDSLSYKKQFYFLESCYKNKNISDIEYTDYINKHIPEPNVSEGISLDYVKIKWLQITHILDDGNIKKSSSVYDDANRYINQFQQPKDKVLLARAYIKTHDVVFYLISRELEKGKKLIEENIAIAKSQNDPLLEIASLFVLSDFLLIDENIDEYIKINEWSLKLEDEISNNSIFFNGIIGHLIDVYAFKGGNDERVRELLKQMYDNPETRVESYSLFANYLGRLPKNDTYKQSIYKLLDTDNAIDFTQKIIAKSEDALSKSEFYYVFQSSSLLLETDGFLIEALTRSRQSVNLTREIYSEDLSNSLADFKIKEEVQKKEREITYQKKQSRLYFIIGCLVAFALVSAIFLLFKTRKQSRLLSEKNVIINRSLKEKELMVKEIHHRVKNNFQIVSSLLELQTKGIEDKKALALVGEGQTRVKSMALIHQRLYQNESGLIDFDDYIQHLVKDLSALYASDSKVETNVSSKHMLFDVDTAIPLGLIINELITNAYKYAFKDNENGKLNISIKKISEGNYKLEVADNGNGLDPSFNIKTAKSLGLRLVNRLTKQLHGKVSCINNGGAHFEILFKDMDNRKQID